MVYIDVYFKLFYAYDYTRTFTFSKITKKNLITKVGFKFLKLIRRKFPLGILKL